MACEFWRRKFMLGRYAFSFDRETFTGQFASRAEALNHAIAQARQMSDPPSEIYVALKISGDPQASGQAQSVMQRMSDRARAASGNAARYLQDVPEQSEAELDAMLEQTILTWLKKHDQMPTFYTVEAISEHPLPTVSNHR
jgi:type II secretory pathway component PulM